MQTPSTTGAVVMTFVGVDVQVLPPRKQRTGPGSGSSAVVSLAIRRRGPLTVTSSGSAAGVSVPAPSAMARLAQQQHRNVPTRELRRLWAHAHEVLFGHPRNAVLAALCLDRIGGVGGGGGGGNGATIAPGEMSCECCGLNHADLLLATDEDHTRRLLARPPPSPNDVIMTSARLRTTTFAKFFHELLATMRELERQRVLIRKCERLEGLFETVAAFLGLGEAPVRSFQAVVHPVTPPPPSPLLRHPFGNTGSLVDKEPVVVESKKPLPSVLSMGLSALTSK